MPANFRVGAVGYLAAEVFWCHRASRVGANGAHSDYDGNQTKLPKILLNGNNICMVSAFLCVRGRENADHG